jgi:hypothetical protein
MVAFELFGLADSSRNVCCVGQCRTGQGVNPDNSPCVRKSEAPPVKGRGCLDMKPAIIIGRFSRCSHFCSNWVVAYRRSLTARKDA